MRFVLLIYSNEASWEALSPEERAALGQGHATLHDSLQESGELAFGAGLAATEATRTVRVRSGRLSVTDGPYAEVKEHLAGFYVVDCDTPERAAEIAARIPDASITGVEVRPVMMASPPV
jgi:hypothetical protein